MNDVRTKAWDEEVVGELGGTAIRTTNILRQTIAGDFFQGFQRGENEDEDDDDDGWSVACPRRHRHRRRKKFFIKEDIFRHQSRAKEN